MPLALPFSVEDESLEANFVRLKSVFPITRKNVQQDADNVVAATGQPAFENSWVNFDTTFQAARFWKDVVGIVYVEGLVKSGAIPTTIFTLPAGYRPDKAHVFSALSNNAVGRVDVGPDGKVVAQVGNTAWISLSGISFRQGN